MRNTWSVVGALLLGLGPAAAQTPRPEFEVASIKPNKVDARNVHRQGNCSAGKFVATDISLKMIIEWAYNIRTEFTVPDWVASSQDTFNIEGKTPDGVTPAVCRLMVQRLLEDRFQLQLHRESKEMPVYFLVASKSGSKLHEVKADAPGGTGEGVRLQGHKIPAKGWEMWMLAAQLGQSAAVGRPVVDKTGLTGVFEFSLDFSTNRPDDNRPNVFTAVQEQLGLKLEPGKAPVEVVVVDRVERPSEN